MALLLSCLELNVCGVEVGVSVNNKYVLLIGSYSIFILGIPPMMSLFTHMMIVAVSV